MKNLGERSVGAPNLVKGGLPPVKIRYFQPLTPCSYLFFGLILLHYTYNVTVFSYFWGLFVKMCLKSSLLCPRLKRPHPK